MTTSNADQSFVLPAEVEFITADLIASQTKTKFEYNETDVVVTHRNTRKRSKVLGEEAAALLKVFQTPHTWAEAILKRARATSQDPQLLADEAFPVLVEMRKEGFLVENAGLKKVSERKSLVAGEHFLTYKIKEVCQVLEDNAVYRVANEQGTEFALKTFTSSNDGSFPAMLQNEMAFLSKLDGLVNPKMVATGEQDGTCYMLTEWCTGMNCEQRAAAYRNYNVQGNVTAMIDLCLSILEAYRHLHSQGVLHADVHTNNVLIDKEGKATIIDFGISVSANSDLRKPRGGVDFYYEPEMALAWLKRDRYPPVSEKGEQYAVAVLLYRLITGHHYLSFSYEPAKAYRQIAWEPPLPFNLFDLHLPAELEAILQKALAKEPEQRFPSLDEMTSALLRCRTALTKDSSFFVQHKKNPGRRFSAYLTRKYGWESPFLTKGLAVPPTCSVNYGAAGIAYLFYRMACVYQEAELLDLAAIWANHAADYKYDYEKAFHTPDRQISETIVGRRSLYHTPTGVHLVQALVAAGKNDSLLVTTAVENYLAEAAQPCRNIDLTLGKAGLLIGAAILLREMGSENGAMTTKLVSFTNALMVELWDELNDFPLMQQRNPLQYYGIAHGWAGLLYATLLWCSVSKGSLPHGFDKRTAELVAMRIPEDDGLRWPVSTTDQSSWSGWCHGNAGYVLLWSLFYRYFGDTSYLQLAEQSAKRLYSDQQHIGHLCCGIAGQTYALLRLHHLTGSKDLQKKIEQLTVRLLNNLGSHQLRNNSLYKGEVGIGVLLAELQRPELARMPLFE